MRDDFSLDELTCFLRRPDGLPVARTWAGSSWDPALEKVARGWLYDPGKTIMAIIRRASQIRDLERRERAECEFRTEVRQASGP